MPAAPIGESIPRFCQMWSKKNKGVFISLEAEAGNHAIRIRGVRKNFNAQFVSPCPGGTRHMLLAAVRLSWLVQRMAPGPSF